MAMFAAFAVACTRREPGLRVPGQPHGVFCIHGTGGWVGVVRRSLLASIIDNQTIALPAKPPAAPMMTLSS
jgi:hypothetical protein